MQKPNVLFISSWYPSREHQTLGNFVQRHAESINPFVNLWVLYATSSESLEEEFELNYSEINRVKTLCVYYQKVDSSIPLLSSVKKLSRYRKAHDLGLSFLKENHNVSRFDLVHCNVTFPAGIIAMDLKKKHQIPYVLTEHWTLFLPYKNDFKKLNVLVKRKMKEIAANAEKVLPVSNHLAVSMQEKGLKGNYSVIPNVADTNLFSLKQKTNGEIKKILHVSTLVDDHKNISGIFRVLKKIAEKRQDFQLVIVTDGDIEKAKFLQKSIGLQDKYVTYHGTKTPTEIAQFYRSSDFFVLFSNYENLPVVMVESFCCGLPFVSSSVGGISEYVNETNGRLVSLGDEEALKFEIEFMLDSVQNFDSKEIRNSAVSQFDNKVVGESYLRVYKDILG